jgi:hypothetical protein
MPKGDLSDRYIPAGGSYDLLLSLVQYNDPLITSHHSYSAAVSQIHPTKDGGQSTHAGVSKTSNISPQLSKSVPRRLPDAEEDMAK